MTKPISELAVLIRSMEPVLREGVYVYATLPVDAKLGEIEFVGAFRESEALTIIVSERVALRGNLPILFRAAWISLSVHSDLQAVGLTAAFATALSDAGISCNVVAAAYHDHLFVPYDRAQDAMQALRLLQQKALQGME
jgi:hypothetical protein